MSEPRIPAAADAPEVYTRERCHIREILNDPRVPRVSLARCRVEPGVTTERHRLAVDEWYLVERGRGRLEVGGRAPFDIGPGDRVEIPAGTPQRVTNTGREDLVFQCLCLPRFRPEAYEALE
ncbi:MAG: cupin domain-containing protein [Gammaproteobacteria bacterium]|nr:cupin domain-containing protein [Gammaproteobacteria bacterium]MDH4254205.1 cupin domain-containing protein [Gammaproteobacteria bacterium]MDH5309024.1 cupin domain-containing protein [Gammaproteobacteria bacterium]